MSDYMNPEEGKEKMHARVLTAQDEMVFSGTTFDADGKPDHQAGKSSFIKFQNYSINPLVMILGTFLLLVFGILFGGIFLVVAGIFSVLAFVVRLFR